MEHVATKMVEQMNALRLDPAAKHVTSKSVPPLALQTQNAAVVIGAKEKPKPFINNA